MAVSTGDEGRARAALEGLRALLVAALDVTAAVAVAGELLRAADGAKSNGGRAA
jgi:hypothetical protein